MYVSTISRIKYLPVFLKKKDHTILKVSSITRSDSHAFGGRMFLTLTVFIISPDYISAYTYINIILLTLGINHPYLKLNYNVQHIIYTIRHAYLSHVWHCFGDVMIFTFYKNERYSCI